MFARSECRLGHFTVGKVWSADRHDINVIRLNDLAPIICGAFKSKSPTIQFKRFLGRIKKCLQFDIYGPVENGLSVLPRKCMRAAHKAHAQNADAQALKPNLVFRLAGNCDVSFHVVISRPAVAQTCRICSYPIWEYS